MLRSKALRMILQYSSDLGEKVAIGMNVKVFLYQTPMLATQTGQLLCNELPKNTVSFRYMLILQNKLIYISIWVMIAYEKLWRFLDNSSILCLISNNTDYAESLILSF